MSESAESNAACKAPRLQPCARPATPTQTEAIWDEFGERLHTFILKRVRDEEAAADILQDAFMKIHSNLASLRQSEKLLGWIYRITHNAINDHYRRQRPAQEMPEDIAALGAPEIKPLSDLAECVRPFIGRIPEPYREALLLSEIHGLTQMQVAERQGVSLSGAKSRVQRGRVKLRKVLLDCCDLRFDHRGSVTDYAPRSGDCRVC